MHGLARSVLGAAVMALVSGPILIVVGVVGWLGRLPRNRWAGIRTPATMRSDGAWRVAHRAGGLLLVSGGAAAVCGALVALALRAQGSTKVAWVCVLGGTAAMLLLAVLGGVRGVRAAGRTPQ